MKTKYQRMTKHEKQNIQSKYFSTDEGKTMKNRLIRLIITGIMGIIFGIYLIYSNYIKTEANIWEYITAGILITASVIFIIGSIKIRHKVLNKETIKNSK